MSARLQALTDGGVLWQLDHLGGGRFEAMLLDGDKVVVSLCRKMTVAEAVAWLCDNAAQRFPKSAYAKARAAEQAPGDPPVG